jgi:hypothetical protein
VKEEDVQPASVYVAIPTYGGIESSFVESLLALQKCFLRLGTRHRIEFLPGESLITRARNRMVRAFLDDTDFSHFLFLDADLSFHPSTIVRLVTSGLEVVAAPYAKKRMGDGLVGNPDYSNPREVDGKTVADVPPIVDGFVRAKDVPTGCLLIARTAFEKLKAAKRPDGSPVIGPYTCDLVPGQKIWPFFQDGPEDASDPNARFLSEDYFFTRLWQEVAGGEAWLDVNAKIKHVGRMAYSAPSFAQQWGEGK